MTFSHQPRSPRRVLEELAAQAAVPRPALKLFLAGGQVLHGDLAGFGSDADGQVATLVTAANAIAFVRVEHVIALDVLSSGPVRPPPPPGTTPPPFGSAPTKLELARALGARGDSLTTALGRALPMSAAPDLDDDGRRAVAAVLPALVDSLRALARDPARRPALDAIAAVELSAGPAAALTRAGDKLLVTAPRAGAWPAAQLRGELEALL